MLEEMETRGGRRPRSVRSALKSTIVAFSVVCSGGCAAAQLPGTTADAIAQNSPKAWIRPDAAGRNLLYVTKTYLPNGGIYVYTYPSLKLVGMLGYGVGARGECVDKSDNVFIVENPDGSEPAVYEYAHGGDTLIARISLPISGQGCSVDPTSERLAVTSGSTSFQVLMLDYTSKRGWHIPRAYSVPGMKYGAFCSFDDRGNFFVDGSADTQSFELAELLKGDPPWAPAGRRQLMVAFQQFSQFKRLRVGRAVDE